MLNRIYGILSCGVVSEDNDFGRYSEAVAGTSTQRELAKLLSVEPDIRGQQIEFIINILRSHYVWIDLIKGFDPDNTYDSEIPIISNHGLTLSKLLDWALNSSQIITEFTIGATNSDTPLDIIVDRLVGLLTSNN